MKRQFRESSPRLCNAAWEPDGKAATFQVAHRGFDTPPRYHFYRKL